MPLSQPVVSAYDISNPPPTSFTIDKLDGNALLFADFDLAQYLVDDASFSSASDEDLSITHSPVSDLTASPVSDVLPAAVWSSPSSAVTPNMGDDHVPTSIGNLFPQLPDASSPSVDLHMLQGYMAFIEATSRYHATTAVSHARNPELARGPAPPRLQIHASPEAVSVTSPPGVTPMTIPTSLPVVPRLRSSSSHTLTVPPSAIDDIAANASPVAFDAPSPFSRALNKAPSSLTVDEASNGIDWTGLLDRELGPRADDVDMAPKLEPRSPSPAATEIDEVSLSPEPVRTKAAPPSTTTSTAGRRRVSDTSSQAAAPMSKLDRRREINRRSAAKLREHRKVELEEARATIADMDRRLAAVERQLEAEREWRRRIVAVCAQGNVDLSKLVPLPTIQPDVE